MQWCNILRLLQCNNCNNIASPDGVGEEQQSYGEEVVQHEDGKVLPNGLDVDGGIGTVEVEADLKDVEPAEGWVHRHPGIPD